MAVFFNQRDEEDEEECFQLLQGGTSLSQSERDTERERHSPSLLLSPLPRLSRSTAKGGKIDFMGLWLLLDRQRLRKGQERVQYLKVDTRVTEYIWYISISPRR